MRLHPFWLCFSMSLFAVSSPSLAQYQFKTRWLGSAPVCDVRPLDCHNLNMDYVRSDVKGDGNVCVSGTKVLCQERAISLPTFADSVDRFTPVAFNIFMRPPSLSHDGQFERMNYIPQAVANLNGGEVDVVMHSELFLPEIKSQLRELYSRWNFRYSTLQELASFSPFSGGITIFSRWPLRKVDYHVFKSKSLLSKRLCSGSDCLSAKGVIHAEVVKNVGGQSRSYHIFATHLQAWDYPEAVEVRKRQVEQLKEFERSLHLSKDEAIFYLGDFNMDWHRHQDQVQKMLTVLNAEVPNIAPSAFSINAHDNALVGRDGSAQACLEDYKATHHCSCCQPEMLDYIFLARDHRQAIFQPGLYTLPMKIKDPINICVSGPPSCKGITAHSHFCSQSWEINDLSDHEAVIATYQF